MPAFAPVESPWDVAGSLVDADGGRVAEVVESAVVVEGATFHPSMAMALILVATVAIKVVDIHEEFAA